MPTKRVETDTSDASLVYTDGACSGNPGPGGWAWAIDRNTYASGSEAQSTNQRMEVAAVLDALRTLLVSDRASICVVSDSTYVVNCFRDRWWAGWEARGWKNSQKQPVANQDLWVPLVALYKEQQARVSFRWVKGHSGNAMNDFVDGLAVAASQKQIGRTVVGIPESSLDVANELALAKPADGQQVATSRVSGDGETSPLTLF